MNALKTGYDLLDERWPAFIERLGVSTEAAPVRVGAPGRPSGPGWLAMSRWTVDCRETLVVVAGLTDANAAQFAAERIDPAAGPRRWERAWRLRGSRPTRHRSSGALYCHATVGLVAPGRREQRRAVERSTGGSAAPACRRSTVD